MLFVSNRELLETNFSDLIEEILVLINPYYFIVSV